MENICVLRMDTHQSTGVEIRGHLISAGSLLPRHRLWGSNAAHQAKYIKDMCRHHPALMNIFLIFTLLGVFLEF